MYLLLMYIFLQSPLALKHTLTVIIDVGRTNSCFPLERQVPEGQCAYYCCRKEIVPQPLTENNVENFIYVSNTEQNKHDQNSM